MTSGEDVVAVAVAVVSALPLRDSSHLPRCRECHYHRRLPPPPPPRLRPDDGGGETNTTDDDAPSRPPTSSCDHVVHRTLPPSPRRALFPAGRDPDRDGDHRHEIDDVDAMTTATDRGDDDG